MQPALRCLIHTSYICCCCCSCSKCPSRSNPLHRLVTSRSKISLDCLLHQTLITQPANNYTRGNRAGSSQHLHAAAAAAAEQCINKCSLQKSCCWHTNAPILPCACRHQHRGLCLTRLFDQVSNAAEPEQAALPLLHRRSALCIHVLGGLGGPPAAR